MIGVAILSFWHVHSWGYAQEVQAHQDAEISAVWDEIPERGRKEAEQFGVPYYADLNELLADPAVHAVIVNTPTNMHRDVIVAAAQAGKHIFTEKVLATTLHECNEILAAVEQAGVKLTVSLPRLNQGVTLAIQDVLAKGLLGELTLVRVRLSHNGATGDWLPTHFYNPEQTGGGALIDLGCHPMYLARLFLGVPETVSASYGYMTGRKVEDNAVAVLSYPNGALGVVEAGFVNAFSPFCIEVHGQEGTLLWGNPREKVLVRSTKLDAGQNDWVEWEQPEDRMPAMEQWIGHIQTGTLATENIQIAVDLTRLMEAANKSARESRAVNLSELDQ